MKVRHVALVSVLALGLPAATLDAREQWGSRGVSPAYTEGYDRGLRAGADDIRRNERFEFTDESDYRRADAGYRREYGRVDWYQTEFRRGFQEGYRIGYQRNSYGRGGPNGGYDNYGRGGPNGGYGNYGRGGPYGGSGQYGRSGRNDVASSNGYADGFDEGFDDGRDRRRNDPLAESRYRSGDHDYRSEYGPRESYRLRYRDGFRQGYEDGYRDGARGVARPWYR